MQTTYLYMSFMNRFHNYMYLANKSRFKFILDLLDMDPDKLQNVWALLTTTNIYDILANKIYLIAYVIDLKLNQIARLIKR